MIEALKKPSLNFIFCYRKTHGLYSLEDIQQSYCSDWFLIVIKIYRLALAP